MSRKVECNRAGPLRPLRGQLPYEGSLSAGSRPRPTVPPGTSCILQRWFDRAPNENHKTPRQHISTNTTHRPPVRGPHGLPFPAGRFLFPPRIRPRDKTKSPSPLPAPQHRGPAKFLALLAVSGYTIHRKIPAFFRPETRM